MAEITPLSILLGLPPLEWRGLSAPAYDTAPMSVTHSQAERKFPYIDGAGHDHTGRDPLSLTARIYFINSLNGETAFPEQFEAWKAALLDGSAGDLRHPAIGPVRARPASFSVTLDAKLTIAGAILDVTWVETVDDPSQASDFEPLQANAAASAAHVDSQLEAIGAPFPEGGPSNLADLFQQVEGFISSAGASVNGLVNRALGTIEAMTDIVETLDRATAFPALDGLKSLYSQTLDIAFSIGAGTSRATSQRTFPFATTIPNAATELGNTTQELMGLNLALLRSPSIPANTPIKYYTE